MTEEDKGTLQEPQVRAMFDRIAGFYDVMNSVMTAGLHHGWRRRAVDLAEVVAGDRVLDVATGTGDLALELARRVGPDGEVIASMIGAVAGDSEDHEYLTNSVKRFPGPHDLAANMDACGLDVRYVLTAGGIIALHVGTRRA